MKIREIEQIQGEDEEIKQKNSYFSELEALTNKIDQPSSLQRHKLRNRHISSIIDLPHFKSFQSVKSLRQKSENMKSEQRFFSKKEYSEMESNFHPLKTVKLKETIHGQKVTAIVKNFVKKVRRNNTQSNPVIYQPYQPQEDNFWNKEGIILNKKVDIMLLILNILHIVSLTILYSLALVVEPLNQDSFLRNFSIFTIFFFTVEIVLNFCLQKNKQGKKLTKIEEIGQGYLQSDFPIHLCCMALVIIDVILDGEWEYMKYIRFIHLLRLVGFVQKLEKLENYFINSVYKEQYWGLAKLFLLNFFFAHLLSICLLGMGKLTENNWLKMKINAHTSPWFEQYVWAYYWGTTIMLSVGFGDLSASNYQEAICLIFIETFSCIALAYNVNCVGSLINNIRAQDIEKNRKIKILNQLCERNNISEPLFSKVNNYLEENSKMKKIFNLQQEKQFIVGLPITLKTDFLKQSNKRMFNGISFFNNFSQKTLIALSEKLEMFVAYPEQIIFSKQKYDATLILGEGKIAYCTDEPGTHRHETPTNTLHVKERECPKLLSLDPLFRKATNYLIKSLSYSVIYHFSCSLFKQVAKSTSLIDFQNLCMLLDRSKHIIDEHQIIECEGCQGKHLWMNCDKVHFVPIKGITITKHLDTVKRAKNIRKSYGRRSKKCNSSLKQYQANRYLEASTIQKNRNRKSHGVKSNKTENSYGNNNDCISNLEEVGKIQSLLKQMNEQFKTLITSQHSKSWVENSFWKIQVDEAHNYRFYFPENNPSQLSEKLFLV